MATDEELQDLGDAVGLVVDRLIQPVEGMHRVISGRAFKYVGPPGAPIQAVHDTMKALRDGCSPDELGGVASKALMRQVTRDSDYQQSMREFLGSNKQEQE